VTESGFGADIGFEKFWNLKCRYSQLIPNCAVVVATIRALKMHGGGPRVVPGKPLDRTYTDANPGLVERGLDNLIAHIETVKKSLVPVVVCLNHFNTDGEEEIALVRTTAESMGARFAVSKHWARGGEGALELAEVVHEACEEKPRFRLLYEDDLLVKDKIARIAMEVYGASGVTYSELAEGKLKQIQYDEIQRKLGVCMVKTHLSLSHDPDKKGRPKGWSLPIRDVLLYHGAGVVVPVAGDIKLMPGTASDPAYRRVDVDVDTGRVRGLF
jgi:formate--tetrahydrofolate ligase